MTDAELRLRCMELAMAQAKIENLHQDRNTVAEIQSWFYDRIMGTEKPAAPAKTSKSKSAADKTPEIFG